MTQNLIRHFALIAAAAAALVAQPAIPQTTGKESLHGSPVSSDGPVNKVIRIDANTRSVNVTQDDIVKFVVNGPGGEKAFAWQFITRSNAVDLGKIAPAGMVDRVIYAYVGPNPNRGCGW